jgi:hypothetical protein
MTLFQDGVWSRGAPLVSLRSETTRKMKRKIFRFGTEQKVSFACFALERNTDFCKRNEMDIRRKQQNETNKSEKLISIRRPNIPFPTTKRPKLQNVPDTQYPRLHNVTSYKTFQPQKVQKMLNIQTTKHLNYKNILSYNVPTTKLLK